MRRIKRLGLAAVMALALSATVGAASASAGKIVLDGGATSAAQYLGALTGGGVTFTRSGGGGVICGEGGALKGIVENNDESLDPFISDMGCVDNTWWGEESWSMNGCKFIFVPGPEGTGKGTAEIGPPGCGPMIVTFIGCEKAIGPQGGIDATYTSTPEGTIEINLNDSVTYTVVSGPSVVCGSTGVPRTGSLYASWEVSAGPVHLTLAPSGPVQVGLFVSGGQFQAEAYPAVVSGEQDPSDQQTITLTANRRFECDQVDFAGYASGPSATLDLDATYANCKFYLFENVVPAAVDMHSCAYDVGTTGSLDVACGTEGDTIELIAYAESVGGKALCRYQIPEQTMFGPEATNFGTGSERGVELDFPGSGVLYKRVLGTIANCGAGSATASYNGASLLTATSE